MRIREQTVTKATPEQVWALLSEPVRHGAWNPRIIATEIDASRRAGLGTRYRITYQMSGRSSQFDAEIVEFAPPRRFVARLEERFKGDGRNWRRFMVESYDVTPGPGGTRVVHDVRIHFPGINLILRALVWLIMRAGHPTGPTFMETFGHLAEEAPAPRAGGATGA
jgi:uncharacterized protein YndB with AHSA1/START domain